MARKDWFSQTQGIGDAPALSDSEMQDAISNLMSQDAHFSQSNNDLASMKALINYLKGLKSQGQTSIKIGSNPLPMPIDAYINMVETELSLAQQNIEVQQDISKFGYTSASGKTFDPKKGWSIAPESFKTTELTVNGRSFKFYSEDMNSLTDSKKRQIIEETLAKGRMLTDAEAENILGSTNIENKIAWYHLMVDQNAINFGFASNGQVPVFDPNTGQYTFDKNGVINTDPNKEATPGTIVVTQTENLQGENVVIEESADGSIEKITTTPEGEHVVNFKDSSGNVFNEKVSGKWDGLLETAGNLLGAIKEETSNIKGTVSDAYQSFLDNWNSGRVPPEDIPTGEESGGNTNTNTFVGDTVPSIDDKGSGIDQFYRQNLDTLNVDPNSQYSNLYKQQMYGAINAQEQAMNSTLAQAELDAYKMLGQQQIELENQIASQRMQAIKSGVTSAQLASQQLANIFAAQSGAAQVAQGVLDQRTSNYANFAQQRANVTSSLYDMLQQNQTTMANANTQLGAAQASYMSYMNQPWQQYDAAAYWQQKLGDDFYLLQGGTPKSYLNNTK